MISLILQFIILCGYLTVKISGVSEEECNVIGAPEVDNAIRTCTFIQSALEDRRDNRIGSCSPSQAWIKNNLNSTEVLSLLETCESFTVDQCPRNNSELATCTTDVPDSVCLVETLFILYDLLHELVNTFPILRQTALDLPDVCVSMTTNITCKAMEMCIWSPYEFQFLTEDVIYQDSIPISNLSSSEVQTLTADLSNAFLASSAAREYSLQFNLDRRTTTYQEYVMSLALVKGEQNDDDFVFQMEYKESISDFFSFENSTDDLIEFIIEVDGVDQDNVEITKRGDGKTTLFEFLFSAKDAYDSFNIFTANANDASNAAVYVLAGRVNQQILVLNCPDISTSISLTRLGFERNYTLEVSQDTTAEQMTSWLYSQQDEIAIAYVEQIESTAVSTFLVWFVSNWSDDYLLLEEDGKTFYPSEFLFIPSLSSDSCTFTSDYISDSEILNPYSTLSLRSCTTTSRLSGLILPTEVVSSVDVYSNRGVVAGDSYLLPEVGQFVLVGTNLYQILNITEQENSFRLTFDRDLVNREEIDSRTQAFLCVLGSEVLRLSIASLDTKVTIDFLSDLFQSNETILNSAVGQIEWPTAKITLQASNVEEKVVAELIKRPLYYLSDKVSVEEPPIFLSDLQSDPSYGTSEYIFIFTGYLGEELNLLEKAINITFLDTDIPSCLVKNIITEENEFVSCDLLDFDIASTSSDILICFSEKFSLAASPAEVERVLNEMCNIDSVSVSTSADIVDESLSLDITFNAINASIVLNPFVFNDIDAANVPQLQLITVKSFPFEVSKPVIRTKEEGIGSLLSDDLEVFYEQFVGDVEYSPCIVSDSYRDERLLELEISEEEISSLSNLDRQMHVCAGKEYDLYRRRQSEIISNSEVNQIPVVTSRDECHRIEMPLGDGEESTERLCVWRGDASLNNEFSWANRVYDGVTAEIIYSPCTVPLTIITSRLMRVYRLFSDDELAFEGYNRDRGSFIKTQINNFLNQDGSCNTPEDELELTEVFTRAWQLLMTHCIYVCSVVYFFSGIRFVYVLSSSKNQKWKFNVVTLKRFCYYSLCVLAYVIFGAFYIFCIFCIPAAVLAKFLGSETLSERTLVALGQSSALVLLYIDVGTFITHN